MSISGFAVRTLMLLLLLPACLLAQPASAARLDVTEFGVDGTDGVDDTAAIQAVIDEASPHDVIYFPDVGPDGCYWIDGAVERGFVLRVDKPLTFLGDGNARYSTLCRSDTATATMIHITSSHVTIDGMRIIGPGYSGDCQIPDPVQGQRTSGIQVLPPDGARFQDITIRNSLVRDFSRDAVKLTRVDGFIIEYNRVEDAAHALIYLTDSRRGRIAHNEVWDTADPELHDYCFVNAYNIVVNDQQLDHASRKVLVIGNDVRDNRRWTGINAHGCDETLVLDNRVSNVGRAIEGVRSNLHRTAGHPPSHDFLVIDNVVVDPIRDDVGSTYPQTIRSGGQGSGDVLRLGERFHHIGNRFIRSVCEARIPSAMQTTERAIWTWNSWHDVLDLSDCAAGPSGTVLSLAHINQDYIIDHNLVNGEDLWESSALQFHSEGTHAQAPISTVPATPRGLRALRWGMDVHLSWVNRAGANHDSFYLEKSTAGPSGPWERLAYRPPDNGIWDFDAPNGDWFPFNPLTYVDRAAGTGAAWYRIRAHNGEQVSGWSNVARAPGVPRVSDPPAPAPVEVGSGGSGRSR